MSPTTRSTRDRQTERTKQQQRRSHADMYCKYCNFAAGREGGAAERAAAMDGRGLRRADTAPRPWRPAMTSLRTPCARPTLVSASPGLGGFALTWPFCRWPASRHLDISSSSPPLLPLSVPPSLPPLSLPLPRPLPRPLSPLTPFPSPLSRLLSISPDCMSFAVIPAARALALSPSRPSGPR